MAHPLMLETIWYDRYRVDDAETKYQEHLAGVQKSDTGKTEVPETCTQESPSSSLVQEIARARNNIKSSLTAGSGVKAGGETPELQARLAAVEKENQELKKVTGDLQTQVAKLIARISALENSSSNSVPADTQPAKPASADEDSDDDDDDDDMFASDEEVDKAVDELRQKRLAAYAEKKSKKPAVIAKSNVIFDVKPYSDETDMAEIEAHVRAIAMDGLRWGASKLVDVAYGIKKLQICAVLEDAKVSTVDLDDLISEHEEVQSVDIAAFNKV